MSTNLLDPDTLATARERANRLRAEWLVMVAEGLLPVSDLIHEAATHEGRPLRRLQLTSVLSAQPDWSLNRARVVVKQTLAAAGEPNLPLKKATVGWLISYTAGGRRLVAYLDTTTPRARPWPGFPHQKPPTSATPVRQEYHA